jgi:hypothetical protein
LKKKYKGEYNKKETEEQEITNILEKNKMEKS